MGSDRRCQRDASHERCSSPVGGGGEPGEPAAQERQQRAGLIGRQADEGVVEHAAGAFDHPGLVELAHPIGHLDPRGPGIGRVRHEPHEPAGLEPEGDLLDVLPGAAVLLGGFTQRGAVPGEPVGQDRQEQPLARGEPEVGELAVGPAGQVLHEHEERSEGLCPSGQEFVVRHIRKVLRIRRPSQVGGLRAISRSSGAPFPSREMTNPALPLNRRWRLAMTGQSVSSSGGTPLTTSHSAKQTSAIRPGLELRRDSAAANYRLVLLAVARAT